VDTLIIGAGMTGMTTAYYLRNQKSLCVVDASIVGHGVTLGTTAKINYFQERIYTKISSITDENTASRYLSSQRYAIDNLKNIVDQEKINCDFKWQVEAITNILKNCVEHSYDGSKIDIDYEQNNIYTKIEIKDYGIGIDEKDLPHIFERFYKGKNSSNDSVGIGLALAKSIIKENNGHIDVVSKKRRWNNFCNKVL